MNSVPHPIPAATVVTARQSQHQLEILMLRKNSKLAYGGMWVFPGGKIDQEDYGEDTNDMLLAAKNAAVREAKEEANLTLNPKELHFFSHWTTPVIRPKRFNTWFFISKNDTDDVEIDGGEIHDFAWRSPQDLLKDHELGQVELVPPTFITLLRLSKYTDYESLLNQIKQEQPTIYKPNVVKIDNYVCHLYEEDAGYQSSNPETTGHRHRLLCQKSGGWKYLRD